MIGINVFQLTQPGTFADPLTEDLRNQLINAGLVPQQLQRQGSPGLANPNKL